MPAVTRSLRSSTRLSTTTTTTTASDERKPAPEKIKTSGAAVRNKKSANSAAPPKVAGDRKRKAEEPKAELADDEPNPKRAKPAKKAKNPTAGKKEAPPKKTKDELATLRDASVPDVNPDAELRDPPGPRYWLMKSEPDVRVEDGYEIKFSIDDLAAKKTPEGWEGIRNYVARNNLRGMRRGDKAFFYHSNCKEPGVVGIMSIVKEHSPDWNACVNDNPYYDAAAPHDGSRWSLVHVKIEHKFPRIVPLSLLKESRGTTGPLRDMELLKQARLSVTKVTREEWDEVIRMARERDEDGEWDRTVEESRKFPNYSAA
ncbi:Thymocyte nuclear protein 1 [Colletotrichum shisoi]|uniref:Thymocyte nuclear protein 1 n=1 Tax=Colletotrichum shisoi TaxID=2078593 RepID=A0A5Q4BFZ1_9PEZI|nr:Thymocyte nuclear protein 1 [Colletotrichum shisoi]